MRSRPRSKQRWHDDQVAARIKTKAADLLSKLKSGNSFDALAKADNVTVQTAKDLKRGPVSNGISAKVIDAVFHTANGAFGSSEGDKPTQWVVFRVSDVKTPPLDPNSADGKKLVQLLQQAVSDDVFTQYLGWLEDNLGTTINQATLSRAVGNTPLPDSE